MKWILYLNFTQDVHVVTEPLMCNLLSNQTWRNFESLSRAISYLSAIKLGLHEMYTLKKGKSNCGILTQNIFFIITG